MKRGLLPLDASGRTPICARLGVAIRLLREALGIRQEDLAADSGVSERMIRYIEAREKMPTIEMVDRIAAALGFVFSELAFIADRLPAQA